jgi:hypothetical protein
LRRGRAISGVLPEPGFGAGFNLAEKADEKKYDRANTDYEMQQKANRFQGADCVAQSREQQERIRVGPRQDARAVRDADRENSFNESIKNGGGGSTDLGVARTFEDVLKMHENMPDLTKQQAQGNIISSPHINDKGEIDGMRYALVTPEWKAAKLDHDEKLHRMVPPTKVGEQPTDEVQVVKAGTMTNGEFHTAQMASDAEKMKYYQEQNKETNETNRTKITAAQPCRQAASTETRSATPPTRAQRAAWKWQRARLTVRPCAITTRITCCLLRAWRSRIR